MPGLPLLLSHHSPYTTSSPCQQSNRFTPQSPIYTPTPCPTPQPSYHFTNYNRRGGFRGRGRGNHHHQNNTNNNNQRGKRSKRTTDLRCNNINEGTSSVAPPTVTNIPDTTTNIITKPNAKSDSDLSFLNEFANTDISVIHQEKGETLMSKNKVYKPSIAYSCIVNLTMVL